MAQLRKGLPKIEYSKLVVLSRTNFSQYRESIKVLGYSRQWPKEYAEPTLEELKQVWSGVDGNSEEDECRREAYLVLYQTIPLSLKYLVRNVKNGDVIALWRVLYNRFLHVTDASLKNMKKEWETLSMSKMKVSLDEFISVVATKANDLRMVGEKVTEKAEAVALVCGLPEEFAWIKNFFGTKTHYSFEEVVEETMKFAADNNLFKSEGIVCAHRWMIRRRKKMTIRLKMFVCSLICQRGAIKERTASSFIRRSPKKRLPSCRRKWVEEAKFVTMLSHSVLKKMEDIASSVEIRIILQMPAH